MEKRLIFSCSGAADVGELADKVARGLASEGGGKMFCLAGIGGNVPQMVEKTILTHKKLVIDGCPVACAKKIFENAGITDFDYVQITELGYEKGKTKISSENFYAILEKIKKKLGLPYIE